MNTPVTDRKGNSHNKRLSRGMRKYLRQEKARIRKTSHTAQEALEKITSIIEHIVAS